MKREIITLSGSTRFKEQFREIERKLTMEGKIVLPPAIYGKSEGIEYSSEMAKHLWNLHLDKISISDGIYVIDPDGQFGGRTQEEIDYAESKGKFIKYYSKENKKITFKKKVVISASSSLRDEINKWIHFFEDKDFDVLNYPKPIKDDDFLKEFPSVHKEFYESLNDIDILFIANEHKNDMDGYIGPAVFAEISFVLGLKLTHSKNTRIVLYKLPSTQNHFYEDIKLWMGNGWLEILNEADL